MYRNKNILIVVPARGGSKGVPFKNIYMLGGKPLIYWTLEVISELGDFVRTYVSTDSEKIADVVTQKGFAPPFKRPDIFSGDNAKDFEVIEHALIEMEKHDHQKYDIIMMLQPTSPFRTASQIFGVLDLLIEKNYDSVWTVSSTDLKFHPIKQLRITDGLLNYILEEGNTFPTRQSLYNCFHVNGVAYAFTRDCILKQKSRKGKKTAPFIIEEKVVNIDTLDDFKLAEEYLQNQN